MIKALSARPARSYLVTVHETGNITCSPSSIHTILTSTDNIQPRERVEVAPFKGHEYNGWANRETWACALHLSNDEVLYRATLELLDPTVSNVRNGETLEAWVTGQVERQLFPAPGDDEDPWGQLWRSMISDVGSFWRVDWAAVAASFLGDLETGECVHCGRTVVLTGGVAIDPAASGDDAIWRETCDRNDTFTAEHEVGS